MFANDAHFSDYMSSEHSGSSDHDDDPGFPFPGDDSATKPAAGKKPKPKKKPAAGATKKTPGDNDAKKKSPNTEGGKKKSPNTDDDKKKSAGADNSDNGNDPGPKDATLREECSGESSSSSIPDVLKMPPRDMEELKRNLLKDLERDDDDNDGDGKIPDVKITPETVPRGFEDQVKDEDGNFDFDKMEKMTKTVHKNKKIQKVLQDPITAEDEDLAMENDDIGFRYEPVMLPKVFHMRNRLRKRANRRREMEMEKMSGRVSAMSLGNGEKRQALDEDGLPAKRQALSDEKSGSKSINRAATAAMDMHIVGHSCTEKSGYASMLFPYDVEDDVKDKQLEYAEGYSHSGCVACRRGAGGAAPVPIEALNNIIRNYAENRGYKDVEELAMDLEEMWEKTVRAPANANRRPGEEPIPIFTAEDILYHITKHDQDPSVWMCNALTILDNHLEQLVHSGVYRVPKSQTKPHSYSGRETEEFRRSYMNSEERYAKIRPQDIRVNENCHKMMLETMKMQMAIYKCKPQDMFLHNKYKQTKSDDSQPWVNMNRPMFTETNQKNNLWERVKSKF